MNDLKAPMLAGMFSAGLALDSQGSVLVLATWPAEPTSYHTLAALSRSGLIVMWRYCRIGVCETVCCGIEQLNNKAGGSKADVGSETCMF